MDLRARQLQYELDSDAQAAAQRLEALQAQAQSGDLNLPRTAKFIANAFSTIRDLLKEAQDIRTRGVGGKYKGWLRKVPADVAAVIALRGCLSVCLASRNSGKPVTLQQLARGIGRMYETEVKVREAERVNPLYMQKVSKRIAEANTTSTKHIRAVYNAAYDKVMLGAIDSSLSEADAMHLGKFGVQACLDAGIIELTKARGSKGVIVSYDLAPGVLDFLVGYNQRDVAHIMDHTATAMLCPPDPWTNLHDGGYLSARRKVVTPLMSLRNIRRAERTRLRDEFTAEKMPIVFQVANYLQSVSYSYHKPTIAAIRRIWKEGGGALGVPTKNGPTRPAFPLPAEWAKVDGTPEELQTFHRWKWAMVKYYEGLRSWRSHVRELSGFFRAIDLDLEQVWFPTTVDTRGRWYYAGTPNPQGSDMAKAVLRFGRKKPLGERGLFWLKVHVANSFGFDKERMADRAAWTDQHWEAIERALDAPEDYPEVWGTDAPWCMYSAAWELREAYRSGRPTEYETNIAVSKDATCSGLQHFAAMLRDPVGGRYVNLYDDTFVGPKQDIYGEVAYNAMKAIQREVESSDPEVARVAQWWIKAGIPRGLAKKPVMTYVYGATLIGTVRYIENYIEEEMPQVTIPDDESMLPYSLYMARKLFYGIAATVPAAAAAMQWLKSVARDTPKGQRMEWTTPTGFKVQHDYQDYDEMRIWLRSCGVERVLVREYNEDTKPVQMQNAISPNFVHALDATHLAFVALLMEEKGLDMVAVHDSFGTHPCDVDVMDTVIRGAFYNLYTENDVMLDFLWEVGGVGAVPNKGTLDLTQVLDSAFFFS